MSLPSVEAARARMLAETPVLPAETVSLEAACGRVLAEPVTALRDQPPFDASAMDGWAVRAEDAATAVELEIVGESAAGRCFPHPLQPGQAVRVFTGAAVPDGADAIVIQEEAQRLGDQVRLGPVAERRHIRPRGGDFRQGQHLLDAGQILDPWRLSLAASAGCGALKVGGRPRVAFLSTGEELARPGGPIGPDQIFESISPALGALATAWGAQASRLDAARDDEAAIVAAVDEVEADLLVTIGGASVGDYDLVKPALTRLGLIIEIDGVNVRPGKPVWFGRLADGRRVLGLPGNPASAFVCAELFLRPLLARIQGAPSDSAFVSARLATTLPANGPREHYMRARLAFSADGLLTVAPFGEQDSSLISVLSEADALLRRLPGAPAADAGELVDVLRLDRR